MWTTCKLQRPKHSASSSARHFYETAGATRDMIQSHMLQLTSLVAMEPPIAFDATAVRNEKDQGPAVEFAHSPRKGSRPTSCAGSMVPGALLMIFAAGRLSLRSRE